MNLPSLNRTRVLLILLAFVVCNAMIVDVQNSTTYAQTASKRFYTPVITSPVPESEAPPCRWPQNYAGLVNLQYKWGNGLQTPGTPWRTAFENAASSWSSTNTKVLFSYSASGSITIHTYNLDDSKDGYAIPGCGGDGVPINYNVNANTFYSGNWSSNRRQALAGHELGHSSSIGHIATSTAISLMGTNPNPDVYYTPQPLDITFVNEIYR